MLKDLQAAKKNSADEVSLTAIDGGKVTCEGYGLEVVSLLDSGNEVVGTVYQCNAHSCPSVLNSPLMNEMAVKWAMIDVQAFDGVKGGVLSGPYTCHKEAESNWAFEEA